ncbi:MAG: D-glycero-alpha-D-manno-heptose-1,7-bisphosphate 7-phosphatase [Candidatus Omnitrophota bacterium]
MKVDAGLDSMTKMKREVSRRVIFLDRDGVINRYPGDRDYVTNLSEFRFLPRALAAIARLTQGGFRIFVVSNQAGISKGLYSPAALKEITGYMLKRVEGAGGRICRVYYCRHRDSDNCSCRKPKPGLIYRALRENGIGRSALRGAFFVGDSLTDVAAARNVGLRSILVFCGRERPANADNWPLIPDHTASNLWAAVDKLISQTKGVRP